MAATGLSLQARARCGAITTSDANQSLISCSADIGEVLIEPTSAAGCYVIVEGGVQDDPLPTNVGVIGPLPAGGTPFPITPQMCGYGDGQAWRFTVARSAAGAVIKAHGVLR